MQTTGPGGPGSEHDDEEHQTDKEHDEEEACWTTGMQHAKKSGM